MINEPNIKSYDYDLIETIQYVISEKCNMNCTYCNVDKKTEKYLDYSDFLIFKKEHLDKCSNYRLDIFGGEALIFADTILKIVRLLEDDDNCHSILIPTNGSIYNNTVKEIINSKLVTNMVISHDGIFQEKNRADYKLYFKELNCKRVHLMIIGDNFNNNTNLFIEQDKFFRKDNIKVDMMFVRDKNTFSFNQAELFVKQFNEYLIYLKPYFKEWKVLSDIPGMIRQYIVQFLSFAIYEHKFDGCSAGKELVSYTNKELLSCTRFSRTNDNYKIYEYDNYLSECNTCDIRDYCGTGCKYEVIQNNGIIPELCVIYKGIFKVLKQILIEDKHLLNLYLKGKEWPKNKQ